MPSREGHSDAGTTPTGATGPDALSGADTTENGVSGCTQPTYSDPPHATTNTVPCSATNTGLEKMGCDAAVSVSKRAGTTIGSAELDCTTISCWPTATICVYSS